LVIIISLIYFDQNAVVEVMMYIDMTVHDFI
jgi:hypothetical protein